MLLSSLIDPRFVLLDVPADSQEGLINHLLDGIYAHRDLPLPRNEIEAAIQAREALGGTSYPNGISIPHARIDLFNDLIIGIARPAKPFIQDGIQIRLVVLILTSKTTSNLYLNCLAAFIKISKSPEIFARILESRLAPDLICVIESQAMEVKPELTVENIMSSCVVSVAPEANIGEVINLFCEKGISYIPVLGPEGEFLGELTVIEILRLGIPNYAQMIGNINALKTFEPMEELLARESTLTARDVMEPPTSVFSRQTSVVEAVFTFTKTKKRHVPVVDGQKLVGIMSYMDVLTKVLRA